MPNITRRKFLEDSILATAAAASLPLAQSSAPAAEAATGSANDKIPVAILGCGIRGKQHAAELSKLAECEITYVCDPDRDRASELSAEIGKKHPQPKAVQDLRRVLEDKSIAAVFITTPNHWHALAAIWAMQAGKDVYVEKPVSHNIVEGRRIVETARKYRRICQAGTQIRSMPGAQEAIRYVHDGKIGKVEVARGLCYKPRGSIGKLSPGTVPPGVDYNLWVGPA